MKDDRLGWRRLGARKEDVRATKDWRAEAAALSGLLFVLQRDNIRERRCPGKKWLTRQFLQATLPSPFRFAPESNCFLQLKQRRQAGCHRSPVGPALVSLMVPDLPQPGQSVWPPKRGEPLAPRVGEAEAKKGEEAIRGESAGRVGVAVGVFGGSEAGLSPAVGNDGRSFDREGAGAACRASLGLHFPVGLAEGVVASDAMDVVDSLRRRSLSSQALRSSFLTQSTQIRRPGSSSTYLPPLKPPAQPSHRRHSEW